MAYHGPQLVRVPGSPVGNIVPLSDVVDEEGGLLLAARCRCNRANIWVPATMIRRGRTLGCSHCRNPVVG